MSMSTVVLVHGEDENTTCEVKTYGATIVSWKVEGQENIFVSRKAKLDGSKAIRGGIPVCFPQFGDWDEGKPKHGFARDSSNWSIGEARSRDPKTGDETVTFKLEDDEATKKIWDKQFIFVYKVTLKRRSLDIEVIVESKSNPLDFTICLHNYFRVPEIGNVSVSNLKGLKFLDKTDNFMEKTENEELVKIEDFTDRVYKNSANQHLIKGFKNGRSILLEKEQFCDTVIWNPWIESAKALSDFDDNEYKEMVCVESVQFSNKVQLKKGHKWTAKQSLTVMD